MIVADSFGASKLQYFAVVTASATDSRSLYCYLADDSTCSCAHTLKRVSSSSKSDPVVYTKNGGNSRRETPTRNPC